MSLHRVHVWGLWRPEEGISSPEAGVMVLSHHVEAGDLTQILQKSRCAGKGRVVSPAHKRTETLNPMPAYSQGCPYTCTVSNWPWKAGKISAWGRFGERGLLGLEASGPGFCTPTVCLLCVSTYCVSVPCVDRRKQRSLI